MNLTDFNKTLIKLLPIFVISFLFLQCRNTFHNDILKEVDAALDNVESQQLNALFYADSIEFLARQATDLKEKYNLFLESASLYQPLDLKKALSNTLEAHRIAKEFKDSPSDSLNTLMRLAYLCNAEGLMAKEAIDIFRNLDPSKMTPEMKVNYYILGVQINRTLSERSIGAGLAARYNKKASEYRDSVLSLDNNNIIIRVNKLLETGKTREAVNIMLNFPPDTLNGSRTGPYYHYLAGLYKQLEQPDSQIYYLSLAAADDLRHGVREYRALTELAEALIPFDFQRAQKYVRQSYNDAYASHSSTRIREVTPIYNKINEQNNNHKRQATMFIVIVAVSFIIISVLIAYTALDLQKKNRLLYERSSALKASHHLLDETNSKLEKMNSLLAEESRTKDLYLKSFMELCLSYLNKMETYRAKLGKMALEGDITKIYEAINSSRYVNQEISEFYEEFDKAFSNLYPDYIAVLNTLLREDSRYPEDVKFSKELRIYALIWIGIEASGEIAKFLRCSESTVYNYRTLMRNRAIDRKTFEESFISISQEKRHH